MSCCSYRILTSICHLAKIIESEFEGKETFIKLPPTTVMLTVVFLIKGFDF